MSRALNLFQVVKKNRLHQSLETTEPLVKELAVPRFKKLKYVDSRPEQNVAQLDTPRQAQLANLALQAKWRNITGFQKGKQSGEEPSINTAKAFSGTKMSGAVFSTEDHPNLMAVATRPPWHRKTSRLDHQKQVTTPHEAIHWSINQIGAKHGPEAARAVEEYLVNHLHPDDKEAISEWVRGSYSGQAPNSEILTHARDMLRSNISRVDMDKIQRGGDHANEAAKRRNISLSPFQKYDQNRHKAGYKKIVKAAASLTDADVQKLASEYKTRQPKP